MRFENAQPVEGARVPLATAREFGLDEDEVWEAMMEVWQRTCAGTVDDPMDELSAVLASRILEHERSR